MLLILTTIRRVALLLFVFGVWAPAAYAWSWPVEGPVVQPFVYDESHPYAAGQHRGVDIGAGAAGEAVVAPAAGTVSYAGSVAANGKTVTIETADGYSVTLTHLGSIAVAKGATVAEQQAVGTVGPSGTPEVDGPYVHLGIRLSADPNGYVDPLTLLPPLPDSSAGQTGTTATATVSTAAASTPVAKKATSSAPPRPHVATADRGHRDVSSREHVRVHETRTDARPHTSSREGRTADDARTPLESRTPRSRPSERPSSLRRPLDPPSGLHAVHEPRPNVSAKPSRRAPSSPVPALVCNWAAALFALAAVFAARRRRSDARPAAQAQVVCLPPREAERNWVPRAA